MVQKGTIPKVILAGAIVGLVWYAVTGKQPEPVKEVLDAISNVGIDTKKAVKKVEGKVVKTIKKTSKKVKKKAKKKSSKKSSKTITLGKGYKDYEIVKSKPKGSTKISSDTKYTTAYILNGKKYVVGRKGFKVLKE